MAALRRRWAGLLGTPGGILSPFPAAAADLPASSNHGANPEHPTAATALHSPNGQWSDLLGAPPATAATLHRAAAADICPAAAATSSSCIYASC